MLRLRIITALIIGPIALACVFLLPHFEFSVFVAAVITVSAWEWANLARLSGIYRYLYAGLTGLMLIAAWFVPPEILLMASIIWWVAALGFVTGYPRWNQVWSSTLVILVIGLVVLVSAFVALVTLKRYEDSSYLICLTFFLVWGADTGAYFSGRAFGQRKLAPRVSPGKSWEGFFGGLITAVLIALGMTLYAGKPSLMSAEGVLFILACVLVSLASVLGDLTISMFKRNRDIKDTSNLLPGHGGFLDRIDSLLSAVPIFAFYLLLSGW